MEKINVGPMRELIPSEQRITATRSNDTGFAEKLKESIMAVNQSQQASDQAIEKVITGKMDIHEGMLKIQEADISLRLLLQVRRKVMDAYTEIMRMQF